MTSQIVTGNVVVSGYTVYRDDVIADDATFTISTGAKLVLTGDDDIFKDDSIYGYGVWRVRGPLELDRVSVFDRSVLANNSAITQTGAVGMGRPGTSDLTVIRNLPGASWDITADVGITPSGDFSRFVNLGLLEKTGGDGISVVAPILNSVGDVEAAAGELQFTGPRARFTGTVGGAGTIDVTTRAVLDDVDVSAAQFDAALAIVLNTAQISGAFDFGALVLQKGRLELTGDGSVLPTVIKGSGSVVVEGKVDLTNLSLYGSVELDNAGSLTVIDDGGGKVGFNIVPPASGPASTVDNLAGATFTWDLNALTSQNLARIDDGLSSAFSDWPAGNDSAVLTFSNQGTVNQSRGWSQTSLRIDNDGVLNIGQAGAGAFAAVKVYGAQVTGGGTVNIDDGGAVVFAAGASAQQTVDFVATGENSADTLALGIVDLADFHAVVSGFATGAARETISVKDWTFSGFSYADGGPLADGLLFENNGAEASLTLGAPIDTSLIQVHAGSSGAGAVITYS